MLNRRLLITVPVLLLIIFAVPSWGAQFRKVSDQQFIDMCKEGDTHGVIEAINAGANVNAKDNYGGTALMWAIFKGHTETVNALIKAGADVNDKDNDGRTALMWAVMSGHIETVNALIKAGADVNARNNDGWTALMSVADTEIVNALIKAGADVNAKNNYGGTALTCAAFNGRARIVNALIEAGADDLADNDGQTALIYAADCIYSNPETVNALIDAGSYVKHRDNDGKTALDYARENPKLYGTDALKRLEKLSK